jgi:cytochrome c556
MNIFAGVMLSGIVAISAFFSTANPLGAMELKSPPKRAKPPAWSRDVLDVFFEDARKQLVGQRPAGNQAAVSPKSNQPATSGQPAAEGKLSWSKIIADDTLVSEVKRLTTALAEPLANPTKFKAGGYKQCRAAFSELAVLFAVIGDYDGDVRFKQDAAGLRDALARAGRNCKAATDQTFSEAAAEKSALDDLVRGEHTTGKPTPLEKWSTLADRELLMKRMEQSMQERITPALGNAKEFSKRNADVKQEAELLAMFANVIQREDYNYWDDDGFRAQAKALGAAAIDLSKAAGESNYDAARTAAGNVGQACSKCHEDYRG